jgi:hypothetical protein
MGIGFGKRMLHHSSIILYMCEALHLVIKTLSTYWGPDWVKEFFIIQVHRYEECI